MDEQYSSAILQKKKKKAGFSVETNIAGMPTGFIATWGSGKPILGINAEFDALPGISQVAGLTEEKAIVADAPGHGCGHNYFGTYSSMAGIAIKQAMEKENIKGTIRIYGTAAEETLVGKVFLVKAGAYDDVDVMLTWHPGVNNRVSYSSSLAIDNFKVRFYGRAAHASSAPWHGRSSLDAVELFNIGMNFMREHVHPSSRIHYVITDGGKAPNIVPPYAEVWYYVRAPEYRLVAEIVERARKAAEGAALMTETRMEFVKITGAWQVLPNRFLSRIGNANVKLIGGAPHGEENQKIAEPFARSLRIETMPFINADYMEFVDEPFRWATEGASTDEGNVSWVVPMVSFGASTFARGTPGHSWQSVAQNCLPTAYTGAMTAAKYITATALDLFADESLIEGAWVDHRESLEKYGPFVDPVKDTELPSFELMHNIKEDAVPKQWEIKPYPKPDLDKLMR
jgi:aminobenzoyl-glutamate utilization protein B